MVYVYYSRISKRNHSLLVEEHLPHFPLDFQNRLHRFKRWEDLQLSLLGRLLLERGIRELAGNTSNNFVEYTPYNKPRFSTNDSIKFNISHSGEIATCAITHHHEIGIDIESIRPIILDDLENSMSKREWEQIRASDNVLKMFYSFWTRKEAVVKAYGEGLSIPLTSFEVTGKEISYGNKTFTATNVNIAAGYMCSLALQYPPGSVVPPVAIRNVQFD
ncbi:MAG: 4'-phosphopantetheinyl transferase superfamily protein [Chryseotalea sp. WA131a]|nr:MAG: 4'-phosphopantetheinyl transferase superfamily protein [Chryseotalea sp. WA131a]